MGGRGNTRHCGPTPLATTKQFWVGDPYRHGRWPTASGGLASWLGGCFAKEGRPDGEGLLLRPHVGVDMIYDDANIWKCHTHCVALPYAEGRLPELLNLSVLVQPAWSHLAWSETLGLGTSLGGAGCAHTLHGKCLAGPASPPRHTHTWLVRRSG